MLYDSVTDATVHHIFVMGFRGSLSLCRAILEGLAQEFEGVSCAWSTWTVRERQDWWA